MRGDASGLEPGIAPDAGAQRRELAEMRRPFDGAALKSQFLRRRIVVNRGMGIVDLRVQHLMRPPPRSGDGFSGFGDDGVKGFHGGSSQAKASGNLQA